MFRMLSVFDLKPGVAPADFAARYDRFVAAMVELGLAQGADPIGRRNPASILDTMETLEQQYFTVMHFTDHAQSERAVAMIQNPTAEIDQLHRQTWGLATNMAFLAWEDLAT
ncbi:hypothetical protein AIOL_003030 [Candidatus Rhodobacter oscarellae]|uniref:Uncharacterized protein n=1 Tax=Candidatus Rhodobacter oscarellae TaxID=1675527 RepID=A0A0J9E5M6_9RHOB|nr:hypothetical protein [Candidatus Rhodobacter lobularis]KMW58060.1 hypothetical protein AIOL_003030 [Candidatus Rhodobacter lobularis]